MNMMRLTNVVAIRRLHPSAGADERPIARDCDRRRNRPNSERTAPPSGGGRLAREHAARVEDPRFAG